MLISNPWKKLQKTHKKKVINEKVTEKLNLFFFFLLCAKVLAYNYFWVDHWIYIHFSTDSNSALNFAFYDTRIEFL
jgi:hypothetical protein